MAGDNRLVYLRPGAYKPQTAGPHTFLPGSSSQNGVAFKGFDLTGFPFDVLTRETMDLLSSTPNSVIIKRKRKIEI